MKKTSKAAATGAPKVEGGAADSAAAAVSASFKNFRHHPEIENFYRFIYENDLRYEALSIVDEMLADQENRKRLRAGRAKH